jgi:hypothetical protein
VKNSLWKRLRACRKTDCRMNEISALSTAARLLGLSVCLLTDINTLGGGKADSLDGKVHGDYSI